MRTSSHSSSRDFSRRFLWGRRMKRREIPGCFAEVGIAPPPRKLLGRPAGPAVDVLEAAVLARCPSCRNTFSTDRPGRQDCPVCGKPLVVPEPPAAPPTPGDLAPEPAGTPWERRAELGFFTAWMQTLQQALLEPGKLFASARLDRGAAQLGFAVLNTSVFWALGQLLERPLLMGQRDQLRRILEGMSGNPDVAPVVQRLLEAQLQAGSPSWVVALALLTPVFTFLLLYVNAALTHGIAVILGQAKRGFPATFAACAYACAPLALLAVPACGSIVGLIWLVALCSHVRSEPRRDCRVLAAAPPALSTTPSAGASARRSASVRLRPWSPPRAARMRSGPSCVSPVFLSLPDWRTRRARVGWPRSLYWPTGSSSPCRGACELALDHRRLPVRLDPLRAADRKGSHRRGRAGAPWAAAAGAVTWLVAYKLLRISSVGSLAGVAVALGVASLIADRYAVYGLLGIALLIILRHRPNIRRLLARQEGQTPPPKGT